MSGGSFNYLCHMSFTELLESPYVIEPMMEALAHLGYAQDAAKETEELMLHLRAMQVRLEVRLERLRPVWKAMEWWKSCDWGEDDLKEALEKYRKQ